MAEKKDEKTNQDVPNGEDVVGTGNDARLKMLDEINNQNDAQLAENGDLLDVHDDGTTTTFAPDTLTDEQIAQREAERAAAEANETGDGKKIDSAAVAKHKIKVNGKELELTTEELIQRAQKIEAADQYLAEASKKLRDAQAVSVAQPQPSVEDAAAKALEEKRKLVRAIQMGTEDEAMAAIEKLQSNTAPSVSPDELARTVDERLTFNDAVQRFQRDFKDLCDDPVLLNIVLERDKELMAQGDTRGYWERYEAIGGEVRQWRDSLAKPATDTKPVDDKLARKASAPAVPKGASTKAPATTEEEDKEETVGEVISAMAKQRGGPQWLRG